MEVTVKRNITRGLVMMAACALSFGIVGAGAQITTGPLYGIDFGGPLYTIDESSGAVTLIGDGPESSVAGLEYDPSTATLYAVGYTDDASLWSLDPETGVATAVGSTGVGWVTGLAMDGAGTLYGVHDGAASSTLVTLSKKTGTATTVAPVVDVDTDDTIRIGALAFDPTSGVLYGGGYDGNVWTIDPATGSAILVGSAGVPDGQLYGFAFSSDGTLFASDFGSLYTIDLATGAATQVGPHGDIENGVEGLAYRTEAPPPPPPPTPPGPSGPGGSGSAPADAVSTAPRFTG